MGEQAAHSYLHYAEKPPAKQRRTRKNIVDPENWTTQ
jgi:hypothetical protein